MAKQFSKKPNDWLKTQSALDYIAAYSESKKINSSDLVKVKNGGYNPGTWMNEDVALEFARWLNPAFAIWYNDRIKELMKYGFTASEQALENLANNPDLIIDRYKKK